LEPPPRIPDDHRGGAEIDAQFHTDRFSKQAKGLLKLTAEDCFRADDFTASDYHCLTQRQV
jgi:hypothetical protein